MHRYADAIHPGRSISAAASQVMPRTDLGLVVVELRGVDYASVAVRTAGLMRSSGTPYAY